MCVVRMMNQGIITISNIYLSRRVNFNETEKIMIFIRFYVVIRFVAFILTRKSATTQTKISLEY